MSEISQEFAQQFIDALPHARALGLQIETVAAGRAVICLPYDKRLIGDPRTGVMHGGAIFALMDTSCGAAVMSLPEGLGTATLDLRIDYMRAATPGQVVRAMTECYHVTRSVAFTRTTAFDDDTENPVATATGAFTYGNAPSPRAPDEAQTQIQEALAALKKEQDV